jgi:hypothetical protein
MLRGHYRLAWLLNRVVVAGSFLVASVAFIAQVRFVLVSAVLAVFTVAYLAEALSRWRRQPEGFEITPEGVRSGVGDLFEPTELAIEDIVCLEIRPGGSGITVAAERKSMTIAWKYVVLEDGRRLTPVEAVLEMASILGVPAFTVHDYHEPTRLRFVDDAYDAPIPMPFWEIMRRELRFWRRELDPPPERD